MQGFLRHSPEESALRKTLLMVYSFSIGCYILSGSFLLTMGFLKPESNKTHRVLYCLLGFGSIGLCGVGAIASKSTEKDALDLATNDYLRSKDQKKDLVRRAYFDEAEREMRFEQAKQQMEMAVNGNFQQIYSALQANIEQQQNQQKLIVNLAQQIQQLKQQNSSSIVAPNDIQKPTNHTTNAIPPEIVDVDPKNDFVRRIDETPWLKQLLLTKPLLIWGEQCSGKTSLAKFIGLCRMVIFNHQVTISDPHAHQNNWPKCFEVLGAEFNYNEVNTALSQYYERLKKSTEPTTSIWDEVTQYQENCDEKLAGRFLKSILSDVRKPPEFPILLSHGNTLSALGGGKGGVKTMQIRGLVEVNLRAKRDEIGNLHPLLQGTVTGLAVDEKNNPIETPIQLEEWMQPSYIFEIFPELKSIDRSNKNKPLSPTGQKIVQNMEKSEPKERDKFWDYIAKLEGQILEKAATEKGLTPSDVLNNCSAAVQIRQDESMKHRISKEFIIGMFKRIAQEGRGRIEESEHNGKPVIRFFSC